MRNLKKITNKRLFVFKLLNSYQNQVIQNYIYSKNNFSKFTLRNSMSSTSRSRHSCEVPVDFAFFIICIPNMGPVLNILDNSLREVHVSRCLLLCPLFFRALLLKCGRVSSRDIFRWLQFLFTLALRWGLWLLCRSFFGACRTIWIVGLFFIKFLCCFCACDDLLWRNLEKK